MITEGNRNSYTAFEVAASIKKSAFVMRISPSFFFLFLTLILLSCSENELPEEFPPQVNDTLIMTCEEYTSPINESLKITGRNPDLYSYDLDLDEENDIEISISFSTAIGGYRYSIYIYPLQDNWSISSKFKTTFLCVDTIYLTNDSTLAYYKTYNCIDTTLASYQHTNKVAQLYPDEDLDNVEINQTSTNELIILHNNITGGQVSPNAHFRNVKKTIFEDKLKGWFVFEKNNSELYGLRIEIQDPQSSFKTIYCHESKRLDCE